MAEIETVELGPGVPGSKTTVNGGSHSVASDTQVLTALSRRSSSAFRPRRLARASTLKSISAMFSQLPCLRVWWNFSCLAMRRPPGRGKSHRGTPSWRVQIVQDYSDYSGLHRQTDKIHRRRGFHCALERLSHGRSMAFVELSQRVVVRVLPAGQP